MHPILFELGSLKVYSYGLLIALGAMAGVTYMAFRAKREVGLSFDQANTLFLLLFIAAFVGGKFFLFFEDASYYSEHPRKLLTGRGFVFYGSFLFAVPTMLWYFKRNKLPVYAMLDIMAITTCIVHFFGRIGCFMAGCCYGVVTTSAWGVTYTNEACVAPLHTALHPTQLYEAGYIFLVMLGLLWLRGKRKFYGQLFITYVLLYAVGRYTLEFFRGDLERGFVIKDYVSHSQFIALLIFGAAMYFYVRLSKRNSVTHHKKPI